MTIKYLSLFSGIGGFELGLENSNYDFECIGFSEVDKNAKSIYRRKFPNHRDLGDATEIRPEELEDFDLLVAGFPCQPFSHAGTRGGLDDTRGTLFFEIARICQEKKPQYLLLENVPGLLSNDKGRTFQKFIGILTEMGYFIQWEIRNSKNYGVAQNRERVFIKGYLRGRGGSEVLCIGEDQEQTSGTDQVNNNVNVVVPGKQATRVMSTDGVSVTLCGNAGGLGGKTGLYAIPKPIANYSEKNHGGANIYDVDGIAPTLTSTNYKHPITIAEDKKAIPVLTPDRVNKRQNGRRMKTDGEPMFTLTAQDKHGVFDGYDFRRLTPLETERLQAFPDNWTKLGENDEEISDTQRYRCTGNAVTTTVVTYIINEMFSGIYGDNRGSMEGHDEQNC